ncbi:MAG: hypothetical protein Q4A15_06425 [Prevotellaceae bacterium]|nr:hypothetical protein [Prevotellaceae bacterium]
MKEKMNIIAEAIYKACAEAGFKVRFSRTEYEVNVNFGVGECYGSISIGVSGFRLGLARNYVGGKLEEIPLDEALEIVTEVFKSEGVVLEV